MARTMYYAYDFELQKHLSHKQSVLFYRTTRTDFSYHGPDQKILDRFESKKVDCLSSSNELLRNTTLLLLINVAENNPILQKIIVFENCFEILLNVALSEGGIDNSPGLCKACVGGMSYI